MSGITKGAAARITAQYPLALYLHCASHCLNLVVVNSLKDTSNGTQLYLLHVHV